MTICLWEEGWVSESTWDRELEETWSWIGVCLDLDHILSVHSEEREFNCLPVNVVLWLALFEESQCFGEMIVQNDGFMP